jgi:hypothetical protein
MHNKLIDIITSQNPSIRDQAIDPICQRATLKELLAFCEELEAFRRKTDNLYHRVRALFFLYCIHKFHLPKKLESQLTTPNQEKIKIPYAGYIHFLNRRFEEAIEAFLRVQSIHGPNDGLCSALSAAYYRLGFQTLADQVKRTVRTVPGNQWMFRTGHPKDHPLRIRQELLAKPKNGVFPILRERTPVRMDLSHSGWSDIFFLAMDFPEGARVLNVSIDLSVIGRDKSPSPPVEAWLRVIDEPIIRLTSVDLGCTADLHTVNDVFDFARDYLGLLKAALIASGIVPPGLEGSGTHLSELLEQIIGPGLGLELVSCVHNIPKGSRLAVSTTLLASLITVCMRATGQAKHLTGPLSEDERRLVLARALLGEWLSGSGGGWQDSGGLWPGIKLITGVPAKPGDPEFGVSRGRLIPTHKVFGPEEVPPAARKRLQESLVLVHGGLAQNVGPILEMVTEKYLLRCDREWQARLQMAEIFDQIMEALKNGEIHRLGNLTTINFFQPIQTIIPWATTYYTELLIERTQTLFGDQFWGFWMLGGASGGGMGFIFSPKAKPRALEAMLEIMMQTKRELQYAMPFAMDPVVYDFSINEHGTIAELREGEHALMPEGYYTLHVPKILRSQTKLSSHRRIELDMFANACRTHPEFTNTIQALFDRLFPKLETEPQEKQSLPQLLQQLGFDHLQHEQIRADLRAGRIGLVQNRLPISTKIEDARPDDVHDLRYHIPESFQQRGLESIANGELAVVTLAGGVGSRWTQGAGVVKALHPFCKLAGRHRTFLELHLAKTKRLAALTQTPIPHVITTSYLTHNPIEEFLTRVNYYGYTGPVLLSPGRSIGLRLVPMVRDLKFMWEEMPQQLLDEQQQKVRESLRQALINWAQTLGEGSDYTDNVPSQCLNPIGHWFEIPNMLRNGVLLKLLQAYPNLKYLMVHNIDTVGADANPAILGFHILANKAMTFEVITRRLDDRGGGLARINGQLRLVEGLALPREEIEFELTYYNTNTCWITIDKLLAVFGLTRNDLNDQEKVASAIRSIAASMPTYITIKEVKKRWGHGQEDVYPVAQYEKLWVDMTSLPELPTGYVVVHRYRGQQLKDPAQLDGWLRDGAADYVVSIAALD